MRSKPVFLILVKLRTVIACARASAFANKTPAFRRALNGSNRNFCVLALRLRRDVGLYVTSFYAGGSFGAALGGIA
jgi:hypothetical protein